jgi:hypothetical protein
MSGSAGGGRKDKKDLSGGKEVSAPSVVTGAYLTCDYSPTDDQSDPKEVGCSVMSAENVRIDPAMVDSLNFEATSSAGRSFAPSKINTSLWGAVWDSLTNLSSTTFHSDISLAGESIPLSCLGVPCKSPPYKPSVTKPVNNNPTTKKITGLKGIWPGKNSKWYTTGVNSAGLNVADQPAPADDYCDNSGNVVTENEAETRMRNFIKNHVHTVYQFLTEITSVNVDDSPSTRSATSDSMPSCVQLFNSQKVRRGMNCSVAIVKRAGSNVLSALVFPKDARADAELQLGSTPHCK